MSEPRYISVPPAHAVAISQPDHSATPVPASPPVQPGGVPEPGAGPGMEPGTQPGTEAGTESGTEPGAPSETGPDTQGVVSAGPDSFPRSASPALWLGGGVLLGAALAAAVAAVFFRRRRKEKKPVTRALAQTVSPGPITVEKLHEQGARKNQQDSFSVSSPELTPTHGLLAVVADGMGGLSDGDKVSATAVAAMMDGFYESYGDPQLVLLCLLGRANQAVNRFLGPDGLSQSGSTLVAGLIREGLFYYVSVGDSRICLYRDGRLLALNREHVFRNELYADAVNGLESFESPAIHPKAAGLTSYLGMGELKYVDIPTEPLELRHGDRIILMSDGVYNALSRQELAIALGSASAANALRTAIQSKNYSNQDNYTAVILGY